MIPDTCGPSSPDAFAFYDPASSSLKTSQGTLLSDSTESSPTLPKWGWMSGGALFERPMLARLIDASGSSSLPTPISTGLNGTGRSRDETERRWRNGDYVSLIDRLALLPTPAAQEPGGTAEAHLWRKNRLDGANRVTPTHLAFIEHLLPTPTASDSTGGEGPTREARQQDGATGGPMLRDVGHLLPTPTAMNSKASGGSTPSAVTLTDAVVRTSLGASTNPRFGDGNTPPEPERPDQLTIEDA